MAYSLYTHAVCTRLKRVYVQSGFVVTPHPSKASPAPRLPLLPEVRGHSPLLGQIIRRVVWFEVNPLACGEVQSVQVCAVNVARRPSKHVQEAIYDGHRLQETKKNLLLVLRKENQFQVYFEHVQGNTSNCK